VLSGRGLCDELITRPEESYRLCCVVVYDLETSRMGAPYIYDISRLRVKEIWSYSARETNRYRECDVAESKMVLELIQRYTTAALRCKLNLARTKSSKFLAS